MQKLLDDDEIRAIFMARGGYGAAQLLPCLKWNKMQQAPKWIVGYSDITALHIYVNNMGIASIHGPMMRGFNKDAASVNALKAMIFGEKADIEIPYNDDCIQGKATGRIVGGNRQPLADLRDERHGFRPQHLQFDTFHRGHRRGKLFRRPYAAEPPTIGQVAECEGHHRWRI